MKSILSLSTLLITLTITAQSNTATWYLNDTGPDPSDGYGQSGIQSPSNVASGPNSFSVGHLNTSSGAVSTTIGGGNEATQIYSTAMGWESTASGSVSTAMGYLTTASGGTSLATGGSTKASGEHSTAMGYGSEASGEYSTAMGYGSEASGFRSTAMGDETSASGYGSFAAGVSNVASGSWGSTALGSSSVASGLVSVAIGDQVDATGNHSTAMGFFTTASGHSSTALGYGSTASGKYGATALGSHTIASGHTSTAIGNYTTAEDIYSFVIGVHNNTDETPNPESFSYQNTAFVIGNGGHDSEGNYVGTSDTFSNAFEVLFDGTTTIAGDLNINSDARLKANIISLGSTLAKLLQIDGKSYTMKKDENKKQKIGVLAQDIEKVFPELVSESNGIKSVNYQGLVPVLINALKEQEERIKRLEELLLD